MKLFGIKFYNPWKPHIVVDGFGCYYVRSIGVFGWKYWWDECFWGNQAFITSYDNLKDAKRGMVEAGVYLDKVKRKVRVVHEE